MGEFFAYTRQKLLRCLIAEFLGTFFFVFFGCLSVISEAQSGYKTGYLAPALCFGLLIAVIYSVIGPTSDCHINPCVTMAFAILKRIPPLEAFLYILLQVTGGVAGSAVLYALTYPDWTEAGQLGLLKLPPGIEWYQGLLMEIMLSSLFAVQLLNSSQPNKAPSQYDYGLSLEIAAAYTALTIAGGGFSGCALNPIRAFGPALILLDFTDHYVYWAGPIVGTLLGMSFYALFLNQALFLWKEKVENGKDSSKNNEDKSDGDKSSSMNSDEKHKQREIESMKRATNPIIVVGTSKEGASLNPSAGEEYISRVISNDDISDQSIVKADLEALSRGNAAD